MPIYEYHCNACGHEFEVMQKMTDRPIRKCEKCGRLKVKKMISNTTFVLKGSGWYVTDYAGKKPNGRDSQAPAGNDTKSDSKDSGSDKKSDNSSTPKTKDTTQKAATA